jgi:hypothetical protein
MATYLELLLNKKVISKPVSDDLLEFLSSHPTPFSIHYAGKYKFAGKGGSLLWIHPPKCYSMVGWALFVKDTSDNLIVLCVWGEWFPRNMPSNEQAEFLKFVTDSAISIVDR